MRPAVATVSPINRIFKILDRLSKAAPEAPPGMLLPRSAVWPYLFEPAKQVGAQRTL